MQRCIKFSKDDCKYNDSNCWYNHEVTNENNDQNLRETETPDKTENTSENHSENPVFCEPPVNLAPPSQAAWLKMVMMIKELNTMMGMMKKTNPFMTI